ncbi:MAG: surA [Chlorobi bacterium]|nr:surA [Chlorobiota bacterium]
MIRSYTLLSLPFGLALLVLGCSTILHAQPKPAGIRPFGLAGNPVLLEVGREKFTQSDIASLYLQNPGRGNRTFYDLGRDTAMQFLNILANYRMKVQAALDAGVDKRPEVMEEITKGLLETALPSSSGDGYLIDRKVIDPAVDRIFKRRDDELRLGVIFLGWSTESPADTLRAFQRGERILALARHGADFLILARDSSDDPKTKTNFGQLPYITSGMILPALEDAAYGTKAGDVYPGLVRVPSGYLVVKVLDRAPRLEVRAAHILVSSPPVADTNIMNNPFHNKAAAGLERIRKGEDFDKVAREISDDKTTIENGGDYQAYYTRSLGFHGKNGRLEPEIEAALFNLKDGEVSDIIKTDYGYHIIKRLESRRPTFEEEKDAIRQFYRGRLISDDRAQYIRGVIEKHGMRINDDVLAKMLSILNRNATAAEGAWANGISDEMRGMTLYSFGGADHTVGSWIDTVKVRPELRALALNPASIRKSIYDLHEREALTLEAKGLETEYPEFATVMKNLRDGVLVGAIENDVLGKKFSQGSDEARGKAYFQANRSRYTTPPKLELTEIFVYGRDEADQLYEDARKGTTPFESLAAQNTQRPDYRGRNGRWSLATAQEADLVREVLQRKPSPKSGEILKPFEFQGGYSVVRVERVEPARQMTYDEAKSMVQKEYLGEYQKQIQKEWLDALRLRYRVDINETALRSLFAAR